MTHQEVWASVGLRKTWEVVISDRAVEHLEGFVYARDADRFKTVEQHLRDNTNVAKAGHVARAIKELRRLRLLQYEQNEKLYELTFRLPISAEPPTDYHREVWMTERHLPPSKARKWKTEIYDLDGGVCAYCYCETPITLDEAELEHIYPYRVRGADSPENLTIACKECNRRKWHKVPADSGYPRLRRLRGRPVKDVGFEMKEDFWHPVFTFGE
ncbi:HNH endonuclease [Chloroflexota bacterium]